MSSAREQEIQRQRREAEHEHGPELALHTLSLAALEMLLQSEVLVIERPLMLHPPG